MILPDNQLIGIVFCNIAKETNITNISPRSTMNLPERNEKIFAMRETGAKYSKIAKAFDISVERARQIYLKLKERKDKFDSYPTLKKQLSKRVQTALTEYYGSEDILKNPQMIADMGVSKILKIKKIGRKALNEIAIVLRAAGCIARTGKWFI